MRNYPLCEFSLCKGNQRGRIRKIGANSSSKIKCNWTGNVKRILYTNIPPHKSLSLSLLFVLSLRILPLILSRVSKSVASARSLTRTTNHSRPVNRLPALLNARNVDRTFFFYAIPFNVNSSLCLLLIWKKRGGIDK